jgi:serine protease AprX
LHEGASHLSTTSWRRAVITLATFVSLLAAGLLAPTTAAPTGDGPAARVEPWLNDRLNRLPTDGSLVVLVAADSAAIARSAIVEAGATPLRTLERVGVSAALLTSAQVEEVRRTAGVRYLQGNRSLAPKGTTATATTRVEQAQAEFRAPDGGLLDGRGVGIAVVDSGMAGDHPMFQDADGTGTRLLNIKQACLVITDCMVQGDVNDLFFSDFTGKDTDVLAAGGHGTHVASIAGGRAVTTAAGDRVRGVASGASLYGLGAGAGIFTLNSAASLNWVLEHHRDPCGAFSPAPEVVGGCAPIKVVNNSYGPSEDGPWGYDPDDVLMRLSEQLVLEGVSVVWAAGNGDSPTATDPKPNDGTFNLTNPAAMGPLPGILMVANYDDAGRGDRNNALNPSSSRAFKGDSTGPAWVHAFPDVAAPGTDILAACRAYLPICTSGYADPDYGAISGTSMAAPHVAGVIALLRQAYPTLSPAAVEDVLEDNAHQFGDLSSYVEDVATAAAPIPGQTFNGDHKTSFDKGHGLVDLAATLSNLSGTPVPAYVAPSAPCSTSTRSFTDAPDDATGAGLVTATPAPSEPTLDVRRGEAYVTADGQRARFEIGMADVQAAPPTASSGDYYRFAFTAGRNLWIEIGRGPTGASASLGSAELNGPTIVSDLPFGFDVVNDEIWAELPLDAEPVDGQTMPAIGPGTRLEGVSVVSQRQAGVLTLTADEADAPCTLVLQADGAAAKRPRNKDSKPPKGSTTAPSTPAPLPAPAERDDRTSQTLSFAEPNAGTTCVEVANETVTNDPSASPACRVVELVVPADASMPLRYVNVTLVPTGPGGGLEDYDLYLIDSANQVVASSATAAVPVLGGPTTGVEQVFGRHLAPGTYRIVVQAFQTLPSSSARLDTTLWQRAAFVD